MTRSRQTADWGSRAGLAKIVPSSVAVGSGSGSFDANGAISFTGASSISINGCFSATYDVYKVLIREKNREIGLEIIESLMKNRDGISTMKKIPIHSRFDIIKNRME